MVGSLHFEVSSIRNGYQEQVLSIRYQIKSIKYQVTSNKVFGNEYKDEIILLAISITHLPSYIL